MIEPDTALWIVAVSSAIGAAFLFVFGIFMSVVNYFKYRR